MVQLSDELVKRLDEEARSRNVSRSALIRTVLTQFLDEESLRAKIERYVESYRRMPQPTVDQCGNLEEDAERDLARMFQEIDAGEEAAGLVW
jgi:hypothetical protein